MSNTYYSPKVVPSELRKPSPPTQLMPGKLQKLQRQREYMRARRKALKESSQVVPC